MSKQSDPLNIIERLGDGEATNDVKRFYPPVVPKIAWRKGDSVMVNSTSRTELRLLVEYFAECFQKEAEIMYGHRSDIQYEAFRQGTEYEAWLLLWNDVRFDIQDDKTLELLFQRDGIDRILLAVGCCFFYRDDKLSDQQKEKSHWVASFAWVHPCYRHKGMLKSVEGNFGSRYKNFWIEGPLSADMQEICKRRGIKADRVLDPKRHG